jgi:hypothetical protein
MANGGGGEAFRRASGLLSQLRELIDSGRLLQAPDPLLDQVARAVGDLARLRSGSESDVLAVVASAQRALDAAHDWLRTVGT